MLSNACKYAIRSILYLAMYADETNKIGVRKIAKEIEVPQPFLGKLLQKLTRKKIVSSTKGPNGGFYLDKKNKENAIWDIINCIDGTDKFDQCFLGLAICGEKNPCPVHFIVAPFKQKLLVDFRDKTISQFTTEIAKKGRVITLKDFDVIKKNN